MLASSSSHDHSPTPRLHQPARPPRQRPQLPPPEEQRILRDYRLAEGRPEDAKRVVPGFRSTNYQRRHFGDVLEAAKIDGQGFTPKCLRDTFASTLVSAGVPIAKVGDLLGHADAGFTASRHYACYCRGAKHLELLPGELEVDLIERAAAPRKVTPVVTPLPGPAG